MRYRDILSIVTGRADEHVISLTEQLAEQNAAYVSTLVVNWRPSATAVMDPWTIEPVWSDLIAGAEKHLATAVADVQTRLERDQDVQKPESMLLDIGGARMAVGSRARHSDLAIVGRPAKTNAEGSHALVEGALFHSGRPVLVAPPEWKRRQVGKRVLVCWKPTREAARALGDADDFLLNASKVTVATVDARPSGEGYGPVPGADIAAHLARRGVTVEVANLDSLGRDETWAILDQALAIDADLIVMGGYGHSRMGEFIFGGVTRDMLKASAVPLFLAH
jgi:nucleotide-binding universal stress UspA family protein